MDKVRIGVVGLRRGRTHVHNFLKLPNVHLVGVADRLESCREAVRGPVTEGGGQVLGELDELLALRPDAVVVATNARLQCQHACQALEAGCAVLSEVPGGFTLDDFVKLRETVERTGQFYMLAENTCFYDFLRYWRRWHLDGRLGDITIAEAEYLHHLPHTLVSADGQFFTPTQAAAEGRHDLKPSWRAAQAPICYLTHDLGPLLEVLDDHCVSVTCRSSAWRCRDTPHRPDGQIALFHTAQGRLLQILVTLGTRRPCEHRYRLFGTEGAAEWFFYEDYGRLLDKDREESQGWQKLDIRVAGKQTDVSTGHGGVDLLCAKSFADALQAGRPSPIDVYRAFEYSVPGIIAAQSAELGGQPLAIPDLRTAAHQPTRFWDCLGLPEEEPDELS